MKVNFFIDRPVFSAVISILIVIVGIIGLMMLPIDQYPQITPPVVKISASYPGASAVTVSQAVATPIEQELNGTPGMLYMESTSSNTGSFSATVTFDISADPDLAAVEIQNRIKLAESRLPAEVVQNGIEVDKQSPSQLMTICLTSDDPKFDEIYLSNFATLNVVDLLRRIPGVGRVSNIGSRYYAMQIWVDPARLANYGLTVKDVQDALKDQNRESAAGVLGQQPVTGLDITIPITAQGRLSSASQFEEIVLRANADGSLIRLRDVARISLEAQSYNTESGINAGNAAVLGLYMLPGANAMEVAENVKKTMKEISANFPEGLEYEIPFDMTTYINESIHEVYKTLFEALFLVIVVVYLSLQSWRATLIPVVAVPISLIGTFGFMLIFGFSLNILTLLGLVLAIGIVVDDAIVVVEAVQAKFDEGVRSPYKATTGAMDGIAAAIVTTSLVFMAVFIPSSFMGGTSGTFYMQFGLTMAVAVGISAINALTLSPALCALIMTPHIDASTGQKLSFSSRFHQAFEASFNRLILRYKGGVKWFFRRKWIVGTTLVASIALLVVLMKTTKTGLVPDEDMGCIFMNVTTPPGSSLSQTVKAMSEVEKCIKDIPQIDRYSNVSGYSMMGGQAPSGGMLIIKLKPWEERAGSEDNINAVINEIYRRTANVKSAKLFVFAQPTIMGYGMGSGFELYVQDRAGGDINTLQKYTTNFIAALNQRPEIQMAYTSFDTKFPQYTVEVDAARCQRAGVTTTDVLSALSGFIGGNYSSNFNRFSKLYRVMVQADKTYRLDKDALNNMFIRTSSGEMAPIGQFVTLTKVYGTETLSRFNLYSSIQVNGLPADGYSTGEAIAAIEEVAKETLPVGYGYEFGGITREEAGSGSNTVIIFGICIIFVYLILCALYESLLVPLAVMLSVPFGLMGSFLFAKMWGLENNIYMQTGLIMLIGLLAKTAILLTEYASARRRQGMTIAQAAVSAAGVRLRPILMTALTMIIGLFPLVVASGAGANGNISLGVGTVGGMLIGTLALLFVVPTLFIVFQTLQERLMPARKHEED